MLFLCQMDMRDFEILSDVIKGLMHENPQRVSSVVRVDVSSPYLQGVQGQDSPTLKLSYFSIGNFQIKNSSRRERKLMVELG